MCSGVAVHSSRPGGATPGPRRAPPALITPVIGVADADRAIAEGADLVDATGLTGQTAAAIRTRHPDARLWTGSPAAVDADRIAAAAGGSPAAVAAAAALSTWLGAPAIRTGHTVAARRAIDMTLSIAGGRLPALTTRGLA